MYKKFDTMYIKTIIPYESLPFIGKKGGSLWCHSDLEFKGHIVQSIRKHAKQFELEGLYSDVLIVLKEKQKDEIYFICTVISYIVK